jgi:hypothetical protein
MSSVANKRERESNPESDEAAESPTLCTFCDAPFADTTNQLPRRLHCFAALCERKWAQYFRARAPVWDISQCLKKWGIWTSRVDRKFFQLKFEYRGFRFLLGVDPIEHFEYREWFHHTRDAFNEMQFEVWKSSRIATNKSFYVIRIDYNAIHEMECHLARALLFPRALYVSTPAMYIGWE